MPRPELRLPHARPATTQEWVGTLESRLTEHEKACGGASASSSPAKSAPSLSKSAAGSVEEAFSRLFEDNINPEIVTLREGVHAMQQLVGKGGASVGGNESDEEEAKEASATISELPWLLRPLGTILSALHAHYCSPPTHVTPL